MATEKEIVIYECGICSCYHPWEFDGDCRDDANRINDADEYAASKGIKGHELVVRSWEDRQAADTNEKESL